MAQDESRRHFLKKAIYVPPILLSFKAVPAFARPGSVVEQAKGRVAMTDDLLGGRLSRDSEKPGQRAFSQDGASHEPVKPGHAERRDIVETGEKLREQRTGLSLSDDQPIRAADVMSGPIPAREGPSS
ncbi:hypothetical protein BDD21_5073 [Thiocapsa rosea]|uniref:Uncharacterized protein n=1 Tax=Thiocapsa rosea TaxID=69360 RepID=A0A495VDZ8_9GAMM|nr:hypothetical protein BDD21_5073 [Thiocapsa rosea]